VLLQSVAAYVGPSIVKAIQMGSLQQLTKDMRATQRLLREQCLQHDVRALLVTMEEQAAALLSVETDDVEVWLVDAPKQLLVLHSAGAQPVSVPIGTGLMGKAVARNAVLTINDLKHAKPEVVDWELERMVRARACAHACVHWGLCLCVARARVRVCMRARAHVRVRACGRARMCAGVRAGGRARMLACVRVCGRARVRACAARRTTGWASRATCTR
jgi:hypothetical protein